MKSFLASIFLLVVCFSFAQPNGFNDYYAVFLEGYNNKNLPKMKEGSELLILNFPDEFAGYYLNSYYHICSGNLKQAQVESNKALNIQPLLPYSYYTQAYIHYLNNNVSEAEKSLNFAVQLNTDKNPDAIFKDMDVIGYFLSKDISSLKGKYSKIFHTYNNPDLALQFDQCFNGAIKGTPCDKIDQLAAKYNTLQPVNPLISKLVPLVKATSFYAKGNITECKKQFETFLNNSKANQALYWQRSYAYWFLSILKRDSFDERGAFLDINAALDEYQNLGFSSYQLANMQLHKIHVLKRLGDKKQEKLQMAYQLEQTANALNNNYYKAKAYNSIGAHYLLD